jgi:hypothetical protein
MISLKLQQDITNIATLDNMVDDEIGEYSSVELAKFVINVKRQIMCVLDPFLSYLQKFEPKILTTCYVLCLIPNTRTCHSSFYSLGMISLF